MQFLKNLVYKIKQNEKKKKKKKRVNILESSKCLNFIRKFYSVFEIGSFSFL